MINWDQFEKELINFLKSKSAKSEDDLATFISNKYDTYIKRGVNEYNQGILSTNKKILKDLISVALKEARNGKNLSIIPKRFSTGVLLYWSSIKMKIDVPPPGAVKVVSNNVIFPGNRFTFPVKNNINSVYLAKAIINSFKLHSKTIKGICTALVYMGNNLVPIQYMWNGIN